MQTLWRFDPTSLKLFIAACDEGSIARAAERESMVPSAVSKRIAELEEAVGAPLLYRHQKGIEPTPAGLCLLSHARHVLDELARMTADLSQFASGDRGHIRISANRSSIIQFLPDDLSRFRRAHPNIAIELQERTSEQVAEAVLGNQCDLGIGTDLMGLAEKGLRVQDYRTDQLVLVVPAGHVLASLARVRFADTLDFGHIALHRDSPLYRMLDKAARAARKSIRYGIHLQSFDAVCRMVQADLGIAVIPQQALSSQPDGPALVCVPLEDEWAARRFQIVSRPEEYLSAVCRGFLAFLS